MMLVIGLSAINATLVIEKRDLEQDLEERTETENKVDLQPWVIRALGG